MHHRLLLNVSKCVLREPHVLHKTALLAGVKGGEKNKAKGTRTAINRELPSDEKFMVNADA
jgi:hypothetical protein